MPPKPNTQCRSLRPDCDGCALILPLWQQLMEEPSSISQPSPQAITSQTCNSPAFAFKRPFSYNRSRL